jgi:medium-chain acyl-[acyl-carrier-protein] hydrolase
MMLPEDFQFKKDFEVGSYQVHPNGQISLCSLADLFQEIAWKHADSEDFGRSLLDEKQMWVLSRFEIQVSQFPSWGDQLRLFTGGRGAARAFAFREFMVWNEQEQVIARAMSSWLLVHTETKRILKPELVLPPQLFDPSKAPSWQPEKLQTQGEILETRELVVQYSDLDVYHHVNNTSYIRWVENLLAEKGIFPATISINYLAECKEGETVLLTLSGVGGERFVEGRVGEKSVFLAKIVFQEN